MNSGEDSLIYGLDTHSMNVVDPCEHFELMSYCGFTHRWISEDTYNAIRKDINDKYAGEGETFVAAEELAKQDYIIVRGAINFELDTVEFLPFMFFSSAQGPPIPAPGDYLLELRDFNDTTIDTIPFQPTEYVADFPAEGPRVGSFMIPVLTEPPIREVRLHHDGILLASQAASNAGPSVEVVSPNGGEVLSENPVEVRWAGNDADGDTLTYTVLYSPDAGSTWDVLTIDWPDTTYEVEVSLLKGSANGLIKITASDGFNTASDESDGTFVVPNNAPSMSILSPKENVPLTGDQLIFFEASAFDREDGQLSGPSIQWDSSIDGLLGTGKEFNKKASDLSEGEHIVTAIVTDSGGLDATASVHLRVYQEEPTPEAVTDLLSIVVDEVGYDHQNALLSVNVTVTNVSAMLIGSPLWVVAETTSAPGVSLASYEGKTASDEKYVNLSSRLGDGQLEPGESVEKRLYFRNPENVRFTFEPSVRGVILEGTETTALDQLGILSRYWLEDKPSLDMAPAGGDGIINFRDFAVFAGNWLEGK